MRIEIAVSADDLSLQAQPVFFVGFPIKSWVGLVLGFVTHSSRRFIFCLLWFVNQISYDLRHEKTHLPGQDAQ